jgi:GNAT superfamily N-acetyltransferase
MRTMNSFYSNLSHGPVCLVPYEAEALAFLLELSDDYPAIEGWYRTRVVPGLRVGTRFLMRVERAGELVGLGIAKNEEERKICTVRVAPDHAGRGIGVRIFDGLLRWLDTDRPCLTVSQRKLAAFERLFDFYGFRQTSVHPNLYSPNVLEFGYNGIRL